MITSTAIASTTTDWITAWATVVAALGGLAGFSALYLEVRRSRGARLRPPEGLMTVLQDFSETFMNIAVAKRNGQGSSFFGEPSRNRNLTLLIILSGQINDPELGHDIMYVRMLYAAAVVNAPNLGMLDNADNVKKQVAAADKGLEATRNAIDRANALIKEHPL